MKNILVLTVALFVTVQCFAISIYEIKYSFKSAPTIEYLAFLVRYENSTGGFMRVRYLYQGAAQVVNMEFDEVTDTAISNEINYQTLRFAGKNPKSILGVAKYYPDYIWFRKLPLEQDYKPWGVTSLNDDGSGNQGTLISIKLLNTSDINEAYANQFFGKSEPFYVNLFRKEGAVTAMGTLRLLIIANTIDDDIGISCITDTRRVRGTFQSIATVLGMKFNYTEISGNSFSKTNAAQALDALNSGNNDIIVVCYSGHGFHFEGDNSNQYPQFDFVTNPTQALEQNTIKFSEVYNKLTAKPGRFKMLLADCCNSFIRLSRARGPSSPSTVRSRVQWSRSNCESLFVRKTGVIAVSSASLGEVALGNNDLGGFFLYNFVESLDKALSVFQSSISWDNIIAETKKAVTEMAVNPNCNRPICTQTPLSYISLQ